MKSPTWSVYDGDWENSCDETGSAPPELSLWGCGLRQKCLLQRGAQGAVYLAEDSDGNLFAVKRHFTQRSDFGIRGISEGALREITLLSRIAEKADELDMNGDFGVLHLQRVVEAPFQELCLILEVCPLDLSKLCIRKRNEARSSFFSKDSVSMCPILAKMNVIQYLMRGILKILRCIHEDCHIIHRDVKLSNLLVGDDGRVRLADFGSARLINDDTQEQLPCAGYVEYTPAVFRTTAIYQAPECLLGKRHYTTAVDIWAAGVVFAELLLQQHLFCGNGELAVLCEIWRLLGTPSFDASSEDNNDNFVTCAVQTESTISLKFPETVVSLEGLDLLKQMLEQDPDKRITASAALSHPFLSGFEVDMALEEARLLWKKKVQECVLATDQNMATGGQLFYMYDEDDSY